MADPKKDTICQIAVRFASSVLVYQAPSKNMMIGLKPDSNKPTMKRKARTAMRSVSLFVYFLRAIFVSEPRCRNLFV